MEFFNIKFVKEVEKHPELYNYTLGEYSRKEFTDKAWNKVAREVNLSAAECKEKWRNLRSTYVKSLKSELSGSGVPKKKPYYLMDAMQFAKPFVKNLGTSDDNLAKNSHPSPTSDVSEIAAVNEDTLFSEDMFSESDISATNQQQSSTSPPVQRTTTTITPSVTTTIVTSESSSASQRDRVTSSPDLMSRRTGDSHNLPSRKRKFTNYLSHSPKMEFSNIKFVKEVEKHPELYNYTLGEYSSKECTNKAWHKVAKEVKLSAGECKEKWRNLRSTFVKSLKFKPSDNGLATKKPYYLMDAMKFAKPFVKNIDISTDSIQENCHQSQTQLVSDKQGLFSEHVYSKTDVSTDGQQRPSSCPPPQWPTPTSARSVSSPGVVSESSSSSECDRRTPSPDLRDRGTRTPHSLPTKKRKFSNYQSDAEKAITEYFSVKAAKISNTCTSKDEREAGIHNFLISLIPDLMQMNDIQLRIYKRKALLLVDEVTGTSPDILNCDNKVMAPSYQGTTGFIINPNQFPQTPIIVQTATGSDFSLWGKPADHLESSSSPEKSK